jgi:polyferredoxin
VKLKYIAIIFLAGLLGAIAVNLKQAEPGTRHIHVENFRYGKSPDIIRCNRGDSLILTFSTLDTGHSFFLEEFGIDAKVSPGMEDVHVFDTRNPLERPMITREVGIIAEHPGILKYLVSKSQYRCHVWCGPLHAFEHGSVIIRPNTLLGFGAGSLSGIFILLFFTGFISVKNQASDIGPKRNHTSTLNKFFGSSFARLSLTFVSLIFMYLVIIISLFGTQMAGRNLGSIAIWIVWLFILIMVLTPFFGKIWCYICPIPFFGDFLQRGNASAVREGKTGRFNNKFSGLNLKWPSFLDNSWLMLFSFLLLGTYSTTIVSIPRLSGFIILSLIILATILAMIFELRAFCRYLCPINAFIGHYARIGRLSLRVRNKDFCAGKCKGKFCELGNDKGWACPYGLNAEKIRDNSKCGLCMECLNSCIYKNTSLGFKKFGLSPDNLTLSESFLGISLLVIGMVYSFVYHGPWSEVREYINIIDKDNHLLFLIYTIVLWTSALLIFPAIFFFTAWIIKKLYRIDGLSITGLFKNISNAITPLGLAIWAAFAVPLLLVNFSFILQSLSDPFGWGWNLLGFAGHPWYQVIPQAIPWIQVLLILGGILFSINNFNVNLEGQLNKINSGKPMRIAGSLFVLIGFAMIFFYSHF